jgi:hypothetical protein
MNIRSKKRYDLIFQSLFLPPAALERGAEAVAIGVNLMLMMRFVAA